VESTLHKGSVFTLTLPAALSYDGKGKTILAVNDSEPQLVQIKDFLLDAGYRVRTAKSGAEAMDCLRHEIPDAVLLDLMMPETDGFAVLEQIRNEETTAHVLIREAFPSVRILSALNGPSGIGLAQSDNPDVILLDILMPGMDGHEVCRRLKADPRTDIIPVVFLTALKADKEQRILALESGAEAFLSKPIDPIELTAVVRAMVKIKKASDQKKNEAERLSVLVSKKTSDLQKANQDTVRLLESLRKENREKTAAEQALLKSSAQLRDALSIAEAHLAKDREDTLKARAIQQRLNSMTMPVLRSAASAALYLPGGQIGGDFFRIERAENVIVFFIGDCEGHGISAAMDSVLIRAVCYRYFNLLAEGKPARFLQAVSADAAGYFNHEKFLTMCAGYIDTGTMTMRYSSANGEMPCILIGQTVRVIEKPYGLHIGFLTDNEYEEKNIALPPDSRLAFFSDALTQKPHADNPRSIPGLTSECAGGFFTSEKGFDDDLRRACQAIRTTFGGLPLHDDLTVILFDFLSARNIEYTAHSMDDFPEIRATLYSMLKKYAFPEQDALKICVCCLEIFTNAVVHGNRNDRLKKITVHLRIDHAGCACTVTDEGQGFDPDAVPNPADIARLTSLMDNEETEVYTHGRGIYMTKLMMDETVYTKNGSEVRILKKMPERKTMYSCDLPAVEKKPARTTGMTCAWDDSFDAQAALTANPETLSIFFPRDAVLNSIGVGKLLFLTHRYRRALGMPLRTDQNILIFPSLYLWINIEIRL